jgi:MFS family permease
MAEPHPAAAPRAASASPGEGASPVLWLIPAVYFLFIAGEFAAVTAIALTLTDQGASTLTVGVLVSALWLGILAASMRAHAWVARHGHARAFVGAMLWSLVSLASMALHSGFGGWLAAAVALGLGGGLVWVAGESWLAEAAPAAKRGLFVGLFETAVGLGLMAGPALVPLGLWLDASPVVLGNLLVLAAVTVSLALLRVPLPIPEPEAPAREPGADMAAVATAWRTVAMPLVTLAALSGVMESGISSLLPSISMRLGFEMAAAAALGTVIGAGSALLQSPFGLLADRTGMPRAMALAWALVVASLAALVIGADQPRALLWGVGFLLGGVGGAIYTLVVIELGHRLRGAGLVKAMGLLVTGYTLGTAGGPAAGGWLFDQLGLRGLSAVLLGVAVVGCALAWRAMQAQPRVTPPAAGSSHNPPIP